MTNPNTTGTVKVDLSNQKPDFSHEIILGRNLFPQIAEYLYTNPSSKYAIITDSNVQRAGHPTRLLSELNKKGLETQIFVFEAGERNKTVTTWDKVSNDIARAGFGRDSAIIALGGGIVGDLAGFVAATSDRGIVYYQAPTSFLAQVDSSVGGKVAVNTPEGKNKRGTFYFPKRIFIDADTLKTLPDIEYPNGFSEAAKHAIVASKDYFNILRILAEEIVNAKDPEILLGFAAINCSIKAEIVSQDPYENSKRRILNFGHTIGHAIEKVSGYRIPHGQASSIGMIVEGTISRNLRYMDNRELFEITRLSKRLGLETKLPHGMSINEIIKATLGDKKSANGKPRYCILKEIGTMLPFNGEYVTEVPDNIVREALKQNCAA